MNMSGDHDLVRRGSVYLMTLITVAAVVSMVLLGVSLRSSDNTRSAMIEEMAQGSNGIFDVSEYAIKAVESDPMWRLTAQSGKVFEKFSVGDLSYSGTVVDKGTGAKPTQSTTNYLLTLTSKYSKTKSLASFELLGTEMDYANHLANLGAVHYWALDEDANPPKAIDSIGAYHGAYLKPSVAGAGYNDEAGLVPEFKDNNDYVNVIWGPSLEIDDGTFSMWVKCTGSSQWSNYAFLGMDYQLNGVPAINIGIWGYGVNVYLNDEGQYRMSSALSTSIGTITPNTWHHIAVTWGAKGLRIYVDGVQKASNASNTDKLKTADAGNGGEQPLHIGAGYNATSPMTPEDGFEGSVSHVALFNVQLDSAQIADLAAIKPDKLTISIVEDSWERVFK